MFVIPCSGQTIYKSVPDSLTCISPSQDVFFLGQSFTIKGLQTSLVLKQNQINNWIAINDETENQLDEVHEQLKLMTDNYNNSQTDLKVEKNKVKNMKNKNLLQKIVLWITAPIAVAETGILSLVYIQKKISN